MKIAWFTPFSGGGMVARFSAMVTRELSRHADVDIWHPPGPPARATALRTIAMPRGIRVSTSMLGAYDLAVYNLGGEEEAGGIVEAACAAPGLAILHGAAERAVRRAYGVVVHSEFARPMAGGASLARVVTIPIAQESLPSGPVDGRRGLGVAEGSLLVLATSTGDGRAQLPALLGALTAACAPGGRFTCAVAGPVASGEGPELERLAGKRVRFIGPVCEEVLRPWIAEADVCVELRQPALELAPALTALFMLHGKPAIVSGAGCYAELSDGAVIKVREAADLERVLHRVASAGGLRRVFGGQARQFAEKTFSPRKYAASLLSLAETLLSAAPVLRCVDAMAARLAETGVKASAAAVDRVAEEAVSLFGAEASSSTR